MTALITQTPSLTPQCCGVPTIPLVVRDGEVFTTSRVVAEYFDKRHDDVLKKIRALDCSDEFNARNFAGVEYLDAKGEVRPMVELTRDGFMFLAMGFTGPKAAAVKEAFILTFNQMEHLLRGGTALPALAEAVTRSQAVLTEMAERVATTEQKVEAVLKLVDIAGKYVALLEANQRPKRRAVRPITPDDEPRILELLAQGLSGRDVADSLGISTASVSLIKNGRYSFRKTTA